MQSEKRRGGVGIYLKNNLDIEVLRCQIINATQLLTIFVLSNTLHFAFAIVYKPHDTNDDDDIFI